MVTLRFRDILIYNKPSTRTLNELEKQKDRYEWFNYEVIRYNKESMISIFKKVITKFI